MRLWYLRRAVPWTALGGCAAVAVVLTVATRRWPETTPALVPYVVVACAAAAGFLMDESSTAVVAVTARGGAWRLLARLGGLVVPLALWVGLLVSLDPAAVGDRSTLLLAGVAACVLGAGSAALLHRTGVGEPGGLLAGLFVGLLTGSTVLGDLLGWQPVLPVAGAASWVPAFWIGVLVAALACAAAGLRRTP